MKRKYVYKGKSEVFVAGVGVVRPGDTIEVDFEIRNRNFYPKKEEKLKVKKSK